VRLVDASVLVDDVRDAARVFVFLRFGGAVRETDLALRVAQQRERELVLRGEGGVLLFVVETDAENLRVAVVVLLVEVPEPGPFPRSTGCVGFRIKPEHDLPAAIVAELHAIAVVIVDVEIRCGVAGLEHRGFSSRERLEDAANGHAAIVGP
jgi:hypothetical protein